MNYEKKRIYMKITFQSGRDQPFMQKKKREKAVTTKQDERWSLLTQIQIFIFSSLCCENQALTHAQFLDLAFFFKLSYALLCHCVVTTDIKPHC